MIIYIPSLIEDEETCLSSAYQNAFLLVAGVLCLVDIVVAVALVIGGEAAAFVLAQVFQRPRLNDHTLQGNRFFLLNGRNSSRSLKFKSFFE